MIQTDQNCFPRGNKKITVGTKRKRENESLFGSEKPKKHKKSKAAAPTVEQTSVLLSGNEKLLARQIYQEGMTVLSCIRNITENAIDLELPGLQCAKVTIDVISDPLKRMLENALRNSDMSTVTGILQKLFVVGQFVPCKLKNIFNKEESNNIIGSILPSDINCGRRHNSFRKGEILWAAVMSELDYGYQLDCGVANCRIFLPTENIEKDTELKIGQPILCKVLKVDNQNSASTLRVGSKKQHIDSVLSDETMPLNLILPGTKVEIFIEKVAKHGMFCKFLDNYVGYVNESQLNPPMRKLKTIKEATVMNAYVLYTDEITKVTHLSLRSLDSEYNKVYNRGDKLSAEVIGKNATGLYLKLNKQERAWISNKRLLDGLKRTSANSQALDEKYSKGSKHQCVVLSYNHMERIYVCGIDKNLLKEKYYNHKDFTVGELVEVVVVDIQSNGLLVSVGQVKGFVPNIHMTDSPYSDNLKKKFSVGKKVKARVFILREQNVIFTLKSKFVKDDNCLSSLENVTPNEIYPALVLKAKSHGLLITFYNNVDGFVPIKEFNFPITQEYKNSPSSYFHTGQVINVRVLSVKTDKIIASLILTNSRPFEVGVSAKGSVFKVTNNGLMVSLPKKGIKGFVPVQHLSIDRSLCQPMLETYKQNDKIPNLLVIKSDESGTIISRREAIAYQRCNSKIPQFKNLRKGVILRCSVESVEENGIFVSSPIKNFTKKIFVKKKFITKGETMPNFEIQQSVLARVKSVDVPNECINLSLKFCDVFDDDIQKSINLFIDYLADEDYLRDYGTRNGWALNEYSIAEKVTCLVKQTSHRGCLVELPNGCQGLVVPSLCGSVKNGDRVEGVVLGYNYQLKYLEICLDQNIVKNINPIQDGSLPEDQKFFSVQKLLTRERYILAISRKSGNSQLVYIPLKLCENDFDGNHSPHCQDSVFRVEICGKFDEKPIAFHKKFKRFLDSAFMRKNQNTSKSDTKTCDNNENCEFKIPKEEIEDTSSDLAEKENECIEIVNEEVESPKDNEKENLSDSDLSDSNEDSGVYSNSSRGTAFSHKKKNNEDDEEKSNTEEQSDSEVENSEENNMETEEETNIPASSKENGSCDARGHPSNSLSILPSISNFFSAEYARKQEESSSDDDAEGGETIKKKKRLTPAERAEQAKLEEERISKIEKELSNPAEEPQSAEQFERILIAEPNSSALWIKYMSFYLAVAEFDKARAVGRRALETIKMTLDDEKFNIWISLLNLENLYGTKESFEQLFEEALKYNDCFLIYMRVLDMLHESGKHLELEEKIKKAKQKFKQEPEMWIHVAKIYYLLGKFEEARNMKNACLKSIMNPKQQYNLIIKFAILEFNHGEIDVGSSILEKVLETYPKRVGTWMIYIDQLISKHQIEEARNLFDRAISLALPLRATKVIYHKYRAFEEKYGTPKSLEVFKERTRKILQEKAQAAM